MEQAQDILEAPEEGKLSTLENAIAWYRDLVRMEKEAFENLLTARRSIELIREELRTIYGINPAAIVTQ